MPNLRFRLFVDYYVGGILHALLKPPTMLLGKLLRRDHDLATCRSVTFVKLLGGGSLVTAYPCLLALRDGGTIRQLRFLGTPRTAAFAEVLGVFDEIIVIPDRTWWGLIWGSLRAMGRLLRTDAIVDLEIHSRLSTILCLLTLARNRIGAYTDNSFWRRNVATHLLFYNRRAPVYEFYAQVARLFGCSAAPFDACGERLGARIAARQAPAPEAAAEDLAIAPVCSDLARERMLDAAGWRAVLARGRGAAPRIHVLGGPDDRAEAQRLCGEFAAAFPGVEFINHAGSLTLEQSAALLRKVKRLVCVDSALLHLARLLGVATESYWGPTDPAMFLAPSAAGRDSVHYRRIGCSPCVHIANVAPCQGRNICMRFAVDPECGLDDHPLWLAQELGKKKGRG